MPAYAAAALINRARPFAAIRSHCQPTVIVIGSGLFLLWHETRRKMPKMGPP